VETKKLVVNGVYAVVRHPQYLGWVLMYLALVFFNLHWAVVVLGFIGMVCVYEIARQEDRRLVERFGKSYERYMGNVPAMNLLMGVDGHGAALPAKTKKIKKRIDLRGLFEGCAARVV